MLLVTGATGYVGRRALGPLRAAGCGLRLLVRRPEDVEPMRVAGDEIVVGDLTRAADVARALDGAQLLLHLAHVRHAPALVAARSQGLRHAVVVSSTWRHSRVASPAVDEVVFGEEALARSDMPWTVLRPTMIYGPGDDRNISRLADQIRRRGWVPVFGDPRVLHQPVYVDDVIDACLACLQLPRPTGRAFDLGGAEAIPYDQLVRQVAEVVGCRVRLLPVPVGLASMALSLAQGLGLRPPITVEQVRRSQEGRAVDTSAARAELGFAPLALAQGLARVYGSCPGSCEGALGSV